MKIQGWMGILLGVSLNWVATAAHAGTSPLDAATVLREAKGLALQCTFRPVQFDAQGNREELPLRSQCAELQVQGREARFSSSQGIVTLELTDSAESDGGDLNELIFRDRRGREITRLEKVLAFGDLLLALVGSESVPEQFQAQNP
jgi:hypothetical protein